MFGLTATVAASAAPDGNLHEGLIYRPEGDAIVIRNGTRWDNRPLYCNERFSVVWTGEMPSLKGEMGVLHAGIERDGLRLPLQQFADRVMRYRPGRMEWELTDPRLAGLKVRLMAVTLADANGTTARMVATGCKPGDKALWCFYSPGAEQAGSSTFKTSSKGFQFDRLPATPLSQVRGSLSDPVERWEALPFGQRGDFSKASAVSGDVLHGAGLLASVPIADSRPQSVAVAADENDPPAYAKLVLRKKALDPAAIADAAQAFELGWARAVDFSDRLVVDTPDPYLNAGAPAAVAAVAGIFVNPTFVHGGSNWRQQQPGWRMMGGAICFGWPDQIRRAVEFWGKLQVRDNGNKLHSEYSPNGCQQAGNSRFFGKGFIDYKQPPHYEFQTQFFDEAVRAWRASADPVLEKALKPMLELHLERCKECFDANGDGIYESYNNTWPSDSIWFNGGGTPEQSAYVYYGHLAAADMCRRAGDTAGAAAHDAMAAKIKKAVNNLLWMPERGHFASCVEPWGLKRQMPDAWVYAQHVPIEAGLTTPVQAWQALFYTESAMERFKLPYGEMRQTSNFVPGQWSVRELFHGDNFAVALGYFLAGQGDEGWQILRGTMIESMYGDGVPKTGYSDENGHFNKINFISPGGLSHPNCAIDFADIVSSYSRAVVEGLFGYRPDYPNGIVRIEPTFPSSWKRASIRTRGFSLEFKDDTCKLRLAKAAEVKFELPVRAAKVRGVTVNGKPAKFAIEPWAGFGMLRVAVPSTTQAVIEVEAEGAAAPASVREETRDDGIPGSHLAMTRVDGDVPRYDLTKVHVPEKQNPKILREAPAEATWKTIDLSAQFNGDIRTIFQQRYASPRPDRVSMRIAYDGWAAWTFIHWGIPTPLPALDKVLAADPSPALVQGSHLVTPQRVHFLKPMPERNIAFTSQWDNWPKSATVRVDAAGDAVWVLVCGSTTPMQGKIANAVLRFRYADGQEETLDLVPPQNFWSLCGFGRMDYDYKRDGFSLPKDPPTQVQLGENCRAMVYGWKLRTDAKLASVTLETLSLDVVIGLMGVSVMNPQPLPEPMREELQLRGK